jgi:hypothetical protein
MKKPRLHVGDRVSYFHSIGEGRVEGTVTAIYTDLVEVCSSVGRYSLAHDVLTLVARPVNDNTVAMTIQMAVREAEGFL